MYKNIAQIISKYGISNSVSCTDCVTVYMYGISKYEIIYFNGQSLSKYYLLFYITQLNNNIGIKQIVELVLHSFRKRTKKIIQLLFYKFVTRKQIYLLRSQPKRGYSELEAR